MGYTMSMPRQYARYPCDLEARILSKDLRRPLEARVRNLSMGGAMVSLKTALPVSRCRLEILDGTDRAAVDARVVRDAGPDPKDPRARCYGLQFEFTPRTEPKLRALVDRMRGGKGAPGAELKRDYWSL